MFPARIIRSAQESLFPYFLLIGQSNLLALSKLALSGQELSGAKRWFPVFAPPLPSATLYVPAECQAILIIKPP